MSPVFKGRFVCGHFLKVYLYKLIRIDLFGYFRELLNYRKFEEMEFSFPNLPAVVSFSKMLADLISHAFLTT